MAQVNSENTTSTPVDQTRRRFLSSAASVAAGSAVLIGAAIPPASAATAPAGSLASGEPDPIFAAIDAHRRVAETRNNFLRVHGDLDRQPDSSEWIAGEEADETMFNAEMDAALVLASTRPTTIAGAAAILAYPAKYEEMSGCECPEFYDDEEISRPFEFFVMRNCAEALGRLAVQS